MYGTGTSSTLIPDKEKAQVIDETIGIKISDITDIKGSCYYGLFTASNRFSILCQTCIRNNKFCIHNDTKKYGTTVRAIYPVAQFTTHLNTGAALHGQGERQVEEGIEPDTLVATHPASYLRYVTVADIR